MLKFFQVSEFLYKMILRWTCYSGMIMVQGSLLYTAKEEKILIEDKIGNIGGASVWRPFIEN